MKTTVERNQKNMKSNSGSWSKVYRQKPVEEEVKGMMADAKKEENIKNMKKYQQLHA